MKMQYKELAGVASVLIMLIGLPALLWFYQQDIRRNGRSDNPQIIELRASAKEGEWIIEPVAGWNYWWKDYENADFIYVLKDRPVILRVTSSDVLHSFAIPSIPEYRKPVDIKAGEWRTFEFTPVEVDTLTYLCWQFCSEHHSEMNGKIIVVDDPAKLLQTSR